MRFYNKAAKSAKRYDHGLAGSSAPAADRISSARKMPTPLFSGPLARWLLRLFPERRPDRWPAELDPARQSSWPMSTNS
jgi:hypothetical protein